MLPTSLTDGHRAVLGGHANTTHIDEASLDFLVGQYSIKSAYDLGCGVGGMVKLMLARGIDCVGIDGDTTVDYTVPHLIHDFRSGPLDVGPRDLCWTVEFLEHVDEQYVDNYFSVIGQCRVVFATASQNFRNAYHVNVRLLPYWVDVFGARGFALNEGHTLNVRNGSSMTRDFVRTTGMVFDRVGG